MALLDIFAHKRAEEDGTVEIIINETNDLLTVAAILVKNGYTVKQGKRKKANSANSYDKVLIVTKD